MRRGLFCRISWQVSFVSSTTVSRTGSTYPEETSEAPSRGKDHEGRHRDEIPRALAAS